VLRFSQDGYTLVTGSEDGTSILWDVTNLAHPRRLATMGGGAEAVVAQTFTPDGHTLGIAGGDHYTLWDVTRRAEMASNPVGRACAIVGRGLSSAEWTNYAPGLPYQRTCPG
jgi:WD40 repeat protein